MVLKSTLSTWVNTTELTAISPIPAEKRQTRMSSAESALAP
jgi:hypothetical protein